MVFAVDDVVVVVVVVVVIIVDDEGFPLVTCGVRCR